MIKIHNITMNYNLSTKQQQQKQYVIHNSQATKFHNHIVRIPPPLFKKRGGVNFNYLPWRGESEK